jgi:hypothetical protein
VFAVFSNTIRFMLTHLRLLGHPQEQHTYIKCMKNSTNVYLRKVAGNSKLPYS